ncbi:MAG: beta-xylosidase [Acidobacteriaceae bacterium]|nr:beta-xylosidase [Acidobacteriaceae bacterium]
MRQFAALLFCFSPTALLAQQLVTIHVDVSHKIGVFKPAWAYFGYDEPNYTYAKDGTKLIKELAALSRTPARIRTHNLLTTGDGTPGLKFGSTNAYTEDASGKPVYDWTIVDRIIGIYLQAGAKPLVEIGFMPKALSSKPEPYTPNFRTPADFKNYYLGWSYPPKDYEKWGELIYQWVKHSVERYGKEEVQSWDWEVWNEPDISYWHGSPEEYDKLYDYSAVAVKRALPTARIGGPGSTSPRNPKAAEFLRQFLQHCFDNKIPLDFISFHAKGSPDMNGDHVRMGLAKQLQDVSTGFQIVHSFDKFRDLPIILTESDPEGCAACSSQINPANAYRNGPLYPAYVAIAMNSMMQLVDRMHINLQGILTWAFEFENKPYFAGYRDLATNGIDKPVLNIFRMAGLMSGDRVTVSSDDAQNLNTLMEEGVRQKPVIDALATRSGHSISVMVWNYQDDDVSGPAAAVSLDIAGVPTDLKRVLLHHYRIDGTHSNAYTAWKQIGSPEHPSPEDYAKLEAAGQLQLLESPRWISSEAGTISFRFTLPLQGISLIQVSW